MDFLNCCAVPEGFRVDRRPEHVEVPCSDSWLQPQISPASRSRTIVKVVHSWNSTDLHGQDPDSAKHCMDIEANELIMVTKRGKVGWTFGKVMCNAAGEPVENGHKEGWFPPSFCVAVPDQMAKAILAAHGKPSHAASGQAVAAHAASQAPASPSSNILGSSFLNHRNHLS